MRVFLTGFMGSGKTTVGSLCADRLGRPLVDTDELVETSAGASVAEIFATAGEARFRALERRAVADACASPRPLVIACGGGAVLDVQSRDAIRATGVVVWLQASPHALAERVVAAREAGEGAIRPLLEGGAPTATLERLARTRAAAYEAAAHAVIDAEHGTPAEVADAVLEEYARCGA